MKYEPIFKFPEFPIFMVDLFLQKYWKFKPIVTIKNGKFEMFLSEEALKEMAEIGFKSALEEGFYEEFKNISMALIKELLEFKDKEIEKMDDEEFLIFLDRLFNIAKRFLEKYNITEFIYFTKIEKEINDYIGDKMSFQEVLSGDVDLAPWPEDKRRLADYIINMQNLKFELRKSVNEIFMGPTAVIPKIIEQLVIRTKRENAPNMTLEEVKKMFRKGSLPDVSDRVIYSYIYYDDQCIKILSGGDAYKKIRELEKDIPKNEVIGTPACRGFVKGKVKIIPLSMTPEKYFSKFEEGDILVSDTTGPEMVPLMEKASAIVADEGGMMSHAAVVSREFNLPCVVGTKYATQVFKDGDIIEVNAHNGVVRKIN